MNDNAHTNFGLLIAYVLPGLIALYGIAFVSPPLGDWLGAASAQTTTLGDFLYITVAAAGAGLTMSTLRWLVFDALHHNTGLPRPDWNLALLDHRVEAFKLFIEIHYRYYQFYGNTLTAGLVAYGCWRASEASAGYPLGLIEVGVVAAGALFFAGSRSALRNYYSRVDDLLATRRAI